MVWGDYWSKRVGAHSIRPGNMQKDYFLKLLGLVKAYGVLQIFFG